MDGFISSYNAGSKGGGKGKGIEGFKKPVSEHKAIQNLKVYESDKLQFVNWNDKLLNALGQVHPGRI